MRIESEKPVEPKREIPLTSDPFYIGTDNRETSFPIAPTPERVPLGEQDKKQPRLTVIIVNFNTRDLLKSCLDSLYASDSKPLFRIFVVDNGSTDGSPDLVRKEFPDVALISSSENLGYSRANNLVLSELDTEYVLLANTDIIFPQNAIQSLINFMDVDPSIGVLGPKLVRPDGSFDPGSKMGLATVENLLGRKLGLAKVFPKNRTLAGYHLRYVDENQISDVDAVAGACMIIRKEVIEKIGLFDENFFLGCEDLDFCYRVPVAVGPEGKQYKVVYYPEVTVVHLGRQTRKKFPVISIFEFHKSAWHLYEKYQAINHSSLYNQIVKTTIFLTAYIRAGVAFTKLLFQKKRL